jgi:PAS domain S-box-containing protein
MKPPSPRASAPPASGGEPWRHSLRRQLLVAFLLAITLSVVLLGTGRVVLFLLNAMKSRQAGLEESSAAIAQMIAAYVEEHRRGITGLAVAVEEIGGGDRARIEHRLREFHHRSPEILTLIVTDAQGNVIASERQLSLGGGPLSGRPPNVSDREYFRQPRDNGRSYLSDAFLGRGFGSDPIVAVAVPWRAADGSFAGIVEGSLDLDRLGKVGAIFGRLPALEIFILDGRRQLLWSGPSRQGEPLTRIDVDRDGARPAGEPARRVLLGRSTVAPTTWSVVVQQPVREIYRSAVPQAWITLAWMAVVFVPSLLFAHYLSRRITRPLEELSASLDQIDLGADLPKPAPLGAHAPREVATIVHATGRLLKRLQVSYAALSQVLAEREAAIEGEIRQRTHAEQERDQLFDLSQEMLCIAGFDGYFKQLNPAWEKALGWPLDELMSRPFLDFVHPGDLDVTMREMQRLRLGGSTSDLENRFRTQDGAYRWLSWGAASLPERGMIYAVIRDVNERKKLEQMQNDFISMVSHELRTPLTSIRGSLALIMGGVAGDLPEKARTLTEIAAKNSERLVLLVNDILDIEKIESGTMVFRFARVEILSLVEQALESNRGYAQQWDVELRLVESTEARIWGDTDRLQQVLANLISNAAKHSPRGETVEIGVRKDNGHVCVSVTDRGAGIPAEFQPRLFEKFAQADASSTRQKGGTGLGLSISKAIVERHSGRLRYESTPGTGTTFTFELPEWRDDVEEGEATAVLFQRSVHPDSF